MPWEVRVPGTSEPSEVRDLKRVVIGLAVVARGRRCVMKRLQVVWVALALAACEAGPVRGPVEQTRPATQPVKRPSIPPVGPSEALFLIAAGGQNLVGLDAGSLVRADALLGVDAGSLGGGSAKVSVSKERDLLLPTATVEGLSVPVEPGISALASPAVVSPTPSPPPARVTVELPGGIGPASTVYLQDGAGRLITGAAGKPISAILDQPDAPTFPGLPANRAVCYLVPLGLEGGKAYGLVGLRPAGTAGGLVDAASTLLVAWLRAQPGWDDVALQRVPAQAWWAAQAAVRPALAADPALVPADWKQASVLAAIKALEAARPELGPLLTPLAEAARASASP
jgi:hypothetical protein